MDKVQKLITLNVKKDGSRSMLLPCFTGGEGKKKKREENMFNVQQINSVYLAGNEKQHDELLAHDTQ
jgi:hypothetical protein